MNEHDSNLPDDDPDKEQAPVPETDQNVPQNLYERMGFSQLMDIPKILHSVEKDGLFTHCLRCNRDLLANETPYMIEKVFRGTEAIIEIAICFDCRQSQEKEGVSEESAEAIKNYFLASAGVQLRFDLMLKNRQATTIDPWIDKCLLTNQPRDQFREYQLLAICQGDKVQCDLFPAFISGPAIEELSELLSEKTRDWMDDFIGSNFGMPSEFCEPPKFTPILI